MWGGRRACVVGSGGPLQRQHRRQHDDVARHRGSLHCGRWWRQRGDRLTRLSHLRHAEVSQSPHPVTAFVACVMHVWRTRGHRYTDSEVTRQYFARVGVDGSLLSEKTKCVPVCRSSLLDAVVVRSPRGRRSGQDCFLACRVLLGDERLLMSLH